MGPWHQNKFRNDIVRCKIQLESLVHDRDEDSVRQFNKAKDELAKLLIQEDNFWGQRAKIHWLKEGDLNTKFFHSMATTRKKKNTIVKLVDDAGTEVGDQHRRFTMWLSCISSNFSRTLQVSMSQFWT